MNIKEINVPAGFRFISQWNEFRLLEFPHILDKQIPGCGFTEYCLRNNMDIVLVCPRKMLLENKTDQHEGEVYYAKNFFSYELGVDKNITKPTKGTAAKVLRQETEEEKQERQQREVDEYKRLYKEITNYILIRRSNNLPSKILVTYDSFRKVKEILESFNVFKEFYTVVDEFQSIFVDSRFKASTELEFVSALQGVQRVCYVSATPMLEEYLEKIPEFANLPYFRLNWGALDAGRISKPALTVRSLKSVNTVAEKIIEEYKQGKFEVAPKKVGEKTILVESREAIFYVNSVTNIIGIIKKCNLSPDEVNILCANTPENVKRIRARLGKKFSIGRVLTQKDLASGQKQKMFTFCTRTVYLGADFYSDNARSFILSDANVDCLAVDITLDLPQILGRQRLLENPWKNKANIYIKTITGKNTQSMKEFEALIALKKRRTGNLLLSYSTSPDIAKHDLAEKYLVDIESNNYKNDYVAVNKHQGTDLNPLNNHLVVIAEQRAFDIQQIDYADRFTVFNRIESVTGKVIESLDKEISEFQNRFESLKTFEDRMRLLCEADLSEPARNSILDLLSEYYKVFYVTLGPERCKSYGYNYARMKQGVSIATFNINSIKEIVYQDFKEEDKVELSKLKLYFENLYKKLDYNKTPKAVDIQDYFEIKEIQIKIEGKRVRGFKLIKKKG